MNCTFYRIPIEIQQKAFELCWKPPWKPFETSMAIAWNPLQLHTNPATFTGSPMEFSKIHSEFNRTYMKFDGIPVKFHAIPVKSLKLIGILSQSISKSLSIQGKISEFLWNTIKILLETLWHSMEILSNPWEFRGTPSEMWKYFKLLWGKRKTN